MHVLVQDYAATLPNTFIRAKFGISTDIPALASRILSRGESRDSCLRHIIADCRQRLIISGTVAHSSPFARQLQVPYTAHD
jgi:hypothetical protein